MSASRTRATVRGTWHRQRRAWQAGPTRVCACCGRPLFGPSWRATSTEGIQDFCAPDCEQLYQEYWIPRYGSPRS